MEDIIMNEEINEETNTEVMVYEEPEITSDGSGTVKVALGLAAIGAAAVAAWKNRDKIAAWNDKRKIKKLEKKGYVISKPEIEEHPEETPAEEVTEEEAE